MDENKSKSSRSRKSSKKVIENATVTQETRSPRINANEYIPAITPEEKNPKCKKMTEDSSILTINKKNKKAR